MVQKTNYDVIVVGGGHAGIEAALVSARMGMQTLFITMLVENIGATSCNPAIGGLAKGHLVKEIDALGGEMGKITDKVAIQFRVLNENKGPAVRGTRAQIDMDRYRVEARNVCLNTENLTVAQDLVTKVLVEKNEAIGVRTELHIDYFAKKVILTTGTFLNGVIHIGKRQVQAGRYGEFPSTELGENLKELGFRVGRLKTGTTARIDAKSIDFSVMEVQPGDEVIKPFSFSTDKEKIQNLKNNNDKNYDKQKEFGIGAQILKYLGIKKLYLISKSDKNEFFGLKGFGIEILDNIKV